MNLAVIDLGSNSIHLVIADAGGRRIRTERAALRLGDGLDADRLERAAATLRHFAGLAAGARLDVAATAWARAAGPRVVAELSAACGLPIRVLDGEEEARTTWGAVRGRVPDGRSALMFDLGGRSTELVVGDRELRWWTSLPFGHLGGEPRVPRPPIPFDLVIGTAGTALTVASIAFTERHGHRPPDRDGIRVSRDEVAAMIPRLPDLPGADPRRRDTVQAGARALLAVLDGAGADGFTSCASGLREGLLLRLRESG